MAGMNRLFEQDPRFPFFGSREEQAAFCSAKNAESDDKTSCAAPKAGVALKKPRRAKVVLKMEYSKQCRGAVQYRSHEKVHEKKQASMSDSDDDVPIPFGKKRTAESPPECDDDDLSILTGEPVVPAVKIAVNPEKIWQEKAAKIWQATIASVVRPTLDARRVDTPQVRAQIERIRQGATHVQLIRPKVAADLALDVEKLLRDCITNRSVVSVDLQVSDSRPCRRCIGNDRSCEQGTPMGALDKRCLKVAGLLLNEMVDQTGYGRRIEFFGLTNTFMSQHDVSYLLGILQNLPLPRAGLANGRARLEIQQIRLSDALREQLLAAGKRVGIDVILSARGGAAQC